MVLHVARKLKDTPEDDPGNQEEAWQDPNGKADNMVTEPDEGIDGGKYAEDGDDDAAVGEAERNPEPAAGARPKLLLTVRVVTQPVRELLDRFEGIIHVRFKCFLNPLPVGQDPILLLFISHRTEGGHTLLSTEVYQKFRRNRNLWIDVIRT